MGRRMAAAAVIAAAGLLTGETHAQESAAAARVVIHTAPQLQHSLTAFLAAPVDTMAALMAGFELGGLRDAGSRRVALYAEVLAADLHRVDSIHSGSSDISMVYVGLADGQFLGFYDVDNVVARPAGGAAAADCSWAPFDLAAVNEQCAATAGCAPGPAVSAASSNIRTKHSTSREAGGTAINLTGWRDYDHRGRDWYTGALARQAAHPGQADMGWADIYTFVGSGNLGASVTSTMVMDDDSILGVLAIDFEMGAVSQLLRSGLTDCGVSDSNLECSSEVAFLVERNGNQAGKVVGLTTGESCEVCDDSTCARLDAVSSSNPFVSSSAAILQAGAWNEIAFWEDSLEGDSNTYVAASITVDYRGLEWLLCVVQNTSCQKGAVWKISGCDTCNNGYTPSVDGKRCDPCPSSTAGSGGLCRQCDNGQQPNADQSFCVSCGKNTYSRYSNASGSSSPLTTSCNACEHPLSEEPTHNRSTCGCREGFENFGRLLEVHADLAGKVAADRCVACDASVFPKSNGICPGGAKRDEQPNVLRLRADKGWWLADLAWGGDQAGLSWSSFQLFHEDATSHDDLSLSDFMYPCPDQSCVGATSETGCRENMTGVLCAVCVNPSDIKVDGKCISECNNGAAMYLLRAIYVYWVIQLAIILVMSFVLRLNSGTLDVHIAGATIAHLTFFIQTLGLLGKFGEGDMFGFTRIGGFKQLLGEGGDDDMGDQCGFRLVYTDLITTVFVRPALVAAASMALLQADFTKDSNTPDVESRPAESTGRNVIQSKLDAVRASHQLMFLTPLQSDDGSSSADIANGLVWRLCCEKTDQELKRIARMRIFLEVLMFSYMPITTQSFMMVLCRSVSTGGQDYSLSIADLSVSCDSGKHIAARLVAGAVFVIYSIGFPLRLAMMQRGRSMKFDPYARVSGVFTADYKYWMSFLMWRRAFLILCYSFSSSQGGVMYLPSGGTVDFRLFPFLLITGYMVIQAHSKPFVVPSDNALEQCVLLALVLTIFADITLGQQISLERQHFHLKHAIILFTTFGTIILVFFHKRANKKAAQLAMVGLTVTKKLFVPHHHQTFFEMIKSVCTMVKSFFESICKDGDDVSDESKEVSEDDKAMIKEVSVNCGMPPKEVKLYLDAFRIIDVNGNGQIDRSELGVLLATTVTDDGADANSDIGADIDTHMSEFDYDDSGTLGFAETLSLLVTWQHQMIVRSEITEAFLLLADDETERITQESLRDNGVSQVEIMEIIAAMAGDSGGDEVISKEQFEAALMGINAEGAIAPPLRRRAQQEETAENPLAMFE